MNRDDSDVGANENIEDKKIRKRHCGEFGTIIYKYALSDKEDPML